jgi:hypothetical protein
MRIKILLLFCLFCVFGFFCEQTSYAAIYKYLDKDGLICFSSDLQSIPEQYRASAKIVSGDADQENNQPAQDQSAPGQPVRNQNQSPSAASDKSFAPEHESILFNNRVLISAIIIVSAVFAFVILGILETDHKKAVAIVRIILLWAVVLYLLIVHAGDAIRMVQSVSGTIEDAKHQSEEKGKKAAAAVKSWGKLMEQEAQAPLVDPSEIDREKKE